MTILAFSCDSQPDVPSNSNLNISFQSELAIEFPDLTYIYNDELGVHDYSNNWDLDGDFQTDSIQFVANDAAHTLYSLRIKLSSEPTSRSFVFLNFNFPYLGKIADLNEASFYPPPLNPQFVVFDFDSDGLDEIFLVSSSAPNGQTTAEFGINSRHVIVDYDAPELLLKDYLSFIIQ